MAILSFLQQNQQVLQQNQQALGELMRDQLAHRAQSSAAQDSLRGKDWRGFFNLLLLLRQGTEMISLELIAETVQQEFLCLALGGAPSIAPSVRVFSNSLVLQ